MVTSVTVRVPATTANLGPGFDSLGMALAITQDVTLAISHQTEPANGLSRLVLDAARSAFRFAHVDAPSEMQAYGDQTIPIGRGLGASAAARAAGIVGANALMGGTLTAEQMLTLGARLEGHADNMAPALFGGLRVVVREGKSDAYRHVAAQLADGLRVVLFIPDFEMPTGESRKLLPQTLSKEDAVYNIGRAAMLVAALAKGEWTALGLATQDRVHQPARARIFPGMTDILAAAMAAGAHASYLSGGGSTIAALATAHEERIARAMMQEAIARGFPGRTAITAPSHQGATIVSSS
jgi:homoserine kinase